MKGKEGSSKKIFFYLKKIFFTFIYFWETAWAREGQRERETQNSKQLWALSCQHRARRGARTHGPWDHDLSQSRTPNWLSHPGAPRWVLFFFIHSGTRCLLVGAFSPFTFSVIIERYGFRVIVMSVCFMLIVMSLVLCGPCNISLKESPLGSLVGLV